MRCVPVPVNVPDMLGKLADETLTADEHRHALEIDCTPAELRASLDPQLLRHILLNLLSNACKYSPAGAPVRLAATVQGDRLELAITDQGIGIPPEDQARLFSFFFRARNVGGVAGSGLGLLVVRRCVEAHGGTIAFASALGEGTRFVVTLPLNPVSL